MKKIKLYEIYSFDINNRLKQKANGAIYNVQIVKKHRRLFGRTIYEARCTATGRMVRCTSDFLTPYPTNYSDAGERVYIRFPDDIPPITMEDIHTIKAVLEYLPKNKDVYTYAFKLKTKLDYYNKVRDV